MTIAVLNLCTGGVTWNLGICRLRGMRSGDVGDVLGSNHDTHVHRQLNINKLTQPDRDFCTVSDFTFIFLIDINKRRLFSTLHLRFFCFGFYNDYSLLLFMIH